MVLVFFIAICSLFRRWDLCQIANPATPRGQQAEIAQSRHTLTVFDEKMHSPKPVVLGCRENVGWKHGVELSESLSCY